MFPKRNPEKPDCSCLVSNQTLSRLRFHGENDTLLILSPLEGNKEVEPKLSQALDLKKQQQRGLISLEDKQGWLRNSSGSLKKFIGWTHLKLSQFPLLLVGIGVPLLVVIASDGFTDHFHSVDQVMSDVMFRGYAWMFQADVSPPSSNDGGGNALFTMERLLQVMLVALLSLFPFQLFYSFDREHQETLRQRFIAQILRFDVSMKTKQDVMARYGKQLDEAYGPERRNGNTRLKPTRLSPLFVASLVLSLGWTITLISSGRPSGDVTVEPLRHPFTFGFLGAYFYALHTLFRSYARRDLQPKTYSHITTRVLTVMVLSWVLQESWMIFQDVSPDGKIPQKAGLNVLAFVAGIVPETALLFIGELLRSTLRGMKRLFSDDKLVDPHEPLTALQGIDLYDRARLQDEGVTNIEGLAHHDLIELMLQTRIPAPRLLDWVDQAILHLHTNVKVRTDASTAEHSNGPGGEKAGDDAKTATMLERLGQCGIRKATDLEQAYDSFIGGKLDASSARVLDGLNSGGQLQILRNVIKDEEWMRNLRCWHDAPGDPEVQDWCPSGRCEPDGTPLPRGGAQDNGAKGPEAQAPREASPRVSRWKWTGLQARGQGTSFPR